MATIETLMSYGANKLIDRAGKLSLEIEGMDKHQIAEAIFAAENMTSEETVIVVDNNIESDIVESDNTDDAIGVNEISESGEFAAHNVDRVISSMKTMRAATRKMIDAAIVNGEFSRTLTTVNGETSASVTFHKGAAKDSLFTFVAGEFSTKDQRAFYAHMKAKFSLAAK